MGRDFETIAYNYFLQVEGLKLQKCFPLEIGAGTTKKCHKSFIIDMLTDADSAVIVRSMIGLAHELGLKAVAEGVENQETWAALRAQGCDVVRGFYFGRPGPLQDLIQTAKRP